MHAGEEKPAISATPATATDITAWIAELGHDDFTQRTNAEKKLADAGESALEPMQKALVNAKDPEIRTRLSRLVAAARVAPIFKRMAEVQKSLGAVEYDIVTTTSSLPGDGTGKMKMHMRGLGDNKHFRMEMGMPGPDGKEMNVIMVADGETFWTEMNLPEGVPAEMFQGKKKMVQKMPMKKVQEMGGGFGADDVARQMRQAFEFTSITDGKEQGEDVYIFEGKPKDQHDVQDLAMAGMKTGRFVLSKKTFDMLKAEFKDADGKPAMTMEMSNIKRGMTFPPELFKYTPPADAHIMDMAKMMEEAGAEPGVVPPPEDIGF